MSKKVLLVGESWTATTTEVKGFNSFYSSKYETGLGFIDKAITEAGYEFVYMPNHLAAEQFPYTLEGLQEYAVIILSDVGADTLNIPVETWTMSKKMPNRCNLLKEYVLQGGGLLMFGGYMTFSGIGGQGKWAHTAVQDVLPVKLMPYDDRMEHCEGVAPEVCLADHAVMAGIDEAFPEVLGYNYSEAKADAEVVATVCGDPFVVVSAQGEGKTAVVSTDCSPHWAPPEFCNWKHYNTLIANLLNYLAK